MPVHAPVGAGKNAKPRGLFVRGNQVGIELYRIWCELNYGSVLTMFPKKILEPCYVAIIKILTFQKFPSIWYLFHSHMQIILKLHHNSEINRVLY